MERGTFNFIQKNSLDGGFLQSEEWKNFQDSFGRKTRVVSSDDFYASVIEHRLPIVGKYFYIPRGPVVEISNDKLQISKQIQELITLAGKNSAGWIRIEPNNEKILDFIKKNIEHKIVRAPHDMQPREVFIIDITKPEEQLLAEMKPKTRYNIRLAEKKGTAVKVISPDSGLKAGGEKYILEFLRLVKVTAERDGITPHPENYYRKMIEAIPGDILKLYAAEFEGSVIAANLVVFYGDTCTYLHGASDNISRNVMAPYLLQWRQIQDAKKAGCKKYDFGGIHTKTGAGITRFKSGFSPATRSTGFPGCYDIITSPAKYCSYRAIQKIKELLK